MVIDMNSPLYKVEVDRKEGENIMYINYMGAPLAPSIADYPEVMAGVIDELIEKSNITRIVFVQQRNYVYPFEQVKLLTEIAKLYNYLMKQENVLSEEKLKYVANVNFAHRELTYIMALLRQDPVASYLEMKNKITIYKQELSTEDLTKSERRRLSQYVRYLEKLFSLLDKTELIRDVKEVIAKYKPGDRGIYSSIFRADILPNFTFTRLVSQIPDDAELVDQYEVKGEHESFTVTILKRKRDTRYLYHVVPPEYSLSEEQYILINLGRNVLIDQQPKADEFTDPDRIRVVFFNIARDLLSDLADSKGMNLHYKELNKLATILVRQTVGFGLIEVLLMDDQLQDIFLNAPIAQNPIFVRHAEYEECVTNIIPSYNDADSWASKLRLQSGRPLDEANPILDTDLYFGNVRARVAAIQRPLSPHGIAYAIRRHRADPWTLPLFINNKMMNSFTAGLLSFLVDGSRTLIVAGTRSSGKTSLLGALTLEIIPRVRILIVEDTLELPVDALRKIGYNIQRMKVRSALIKTTTEVEASEGIRTSLRLGDSALIVGEVRSTEAKALYEAMRVGALANVVAGTIHGASPYGVFDRVVNDLGVPVTSFKATDIVIIANPVKTPDGLHSKKRLIQVTEVRKHWTHDPLEEKGFVDLVKYNVENDELEPTEDLINGDSEVIKSVAGSVKGWAGNWDAVYDNILLRGKIKQEIVDQAKKLKMPELMEAKFVAKSNDVFHKVSDEVTREHGLPDSKKVFPKWQKWLNSVTKKTK